MSDKQPWINLKGEEVHLSILVSPASKVTKLRGIHGDRLKISVKAPPEDGRANEALLKFIADLIGCSQKALSVVRGQTSREKVVAVRGVAFEVVKAVFTIK